MLTRDSRFWWLGMVGAVILAVSSRWDLIDPLLPAQHTDKVHAAVELAALILGIVSGKMATARWRHRRSHTRMTKTR